jgi:glycosyltransferase involved in cell wall biosynthesis
MYAAFPTAAPSFEPLSSSTCCVTAFPPETTALPDESMVCPGPGEKAVVRVLHLINGEHYSGAERVQDLLGSQLRQFGFDVAFVAVKPGRFREAYVSRHVPLDDLPMASRFDARPIRKLVQMVRAGDYRILHAHTPRTALLAAVVSRITGVPFVYHVHSPTSADSTRHWTNRINAWTERLSLAQASALVAVSHSLGRRIAPLATKRRRVAVVPNGVPVRTPRPERTPASTTWTLGCVALFRPRKGIEVLLEAMALLHKDNVPVRLRAVGGFETESYRQEVLAKAERLGIADHIDWIGFTRDVDAELAKMDVFVLPSLFGEGLPMVVLESMAAGVPIVATEVEGIPEAIRNGEEGLLVEPGRADAMALAIGRIVRGEVSWQTLRRNAFERHHAQFSDVSMAAGVASVYRDVLESAK